MDAVSAGAEVPAGVPAPNETRRPPNHDRRSRRAHEAILKATLDLLTDTPYAILTIEAIATRAGVGKATVYRWWPSKGALVAEAVSSSLTVEDPPETGDLRADLVAALEISIANYLLPPKSELVHALASDISRDPVLLASFRESFLIPRRRVFGRLIRRGMEEGLLPPSCNPELVMDMWAGALFYRGFFKHLPADRTLAAELVDAVLAPWLPANPSVTNGPPGRKAKGAPRERESKK